MPILLGLKEPLLDVVCVQFIDHLEGQVYSSVNFPSYVVYLTGQETAVVQLTMPVVTVFHGERCRIRTLHLGAHHVSCLVYTTVRVYCNMVT